MSFPDIKERFNNVRDLKELLSLGQDVIAHIQSSKTQQVAITTFSLLELQIAEFSLDFASYEISSTADNLKLLREIRTVVAPILNSLDEDSINEAKFHDHKAYIIKVNQILEDLILNKEFEKALWIGNISPEDVRIQKPHQHTLILNFELIRFLLETSTGSDQNSLKENQDINFVLENFLQYYSKYFNELFLDNDSNAPFGSNDFEYLIDQIKDLIQQLFEKRRSYNITTLSMLETLLNFLLYKLELERDEKLELEKMGLIQELEDLTSNQNEQVLKGSALFFSDKVIELADTYLLGNPMALVGVIFLNSEEMDFFKACFLRNTILQFIISPPKDNSHLTNFSYVLTLLRHDISFTKEMAFLWILIKYRFPTFKEEICKLIKEQEEGIEAEISALKDSSTYLEDELTFVKTLYQMFAYNSFTKILELQTNYYDYENVKALASISNIIQVKKAEKEGVIRLSFIEIEFFINNLTYLIDQGFESEDESLSVLLLFYSAFYEEIYLNIDSNQHNYELDVAKLQYLMKVLYLKMNDENITSFSKLQQLLSLIYFKYQENANKDFKKELDDIRNKLLITDGLFEGHFEENELLQIETTVKNLASKYLNEDPSALIDDLLTYLKRDELKKQLLEYIIADYFILHNDEEIPSISLCKLLSLLKHEVMFDEDRAHIWALLKLISKAVIPIESLILGSKKDVNVKYRSALKNLAESSSTIEVVEFNKNFASLSIHEQLVKYFTSKKHLLIDPDYQVLHCIYPNIEVRLLQEEEILVVDIAKDFLGMMPRQLIAGLLHDSGTHVIGELINKREHAYYGYAYDFCSIAVYTSKISQDLIDQLGETWLSKLLNFYIYVIDLKYGEEGFDEFIDFFELLYIHAFSQSTSVVFTDNDKKKVISLITKIRKNVTDDSIYDVVKALGIPYKFIEANSIMNTVGEMDFTSLKDYIKAFIEFFKVEYKDTLSTIEKCDHLEQALKLAQDKNKNFRERILTFYHLAKFKYKMKSQLSGATATPLIKFYEERLDHIWNQITIYKEGCSLAIDGFYCYFIDILEEISNKNLTEQEIKDILIDKITSANSFLKALTVKFFEKNLASAIQIVLARIVSQENINKYGILIYNFCGLFVEVILQNYLLKGENRRKLALEVMQILKAGVIYLDSRSFIPLWSQLHMTFNNQKLSFKDLVQDSQMYDVEFKNKVIQLFTCPSEDEAGEEDDLTLEHLSFDPKPNKYSSYFLESCRNYPFVTKASFPNVFKELDQQTVNYANVYYDLLLNNRPSLLVNIFYEQLTKTDLWEFNKSMVALIAKIACAKEDEPIYFNNLEFVETIFDYCDVGFEEALKPQMQEFYELISAIQINSDSDFLAYLMIKKMEYLYIRAIFQEKLQKSLDEIFPKGLTEGRLPLLITKKASDLKKSFGELKKEMPQLDNLTLITYIGHFFRDIRSVNRRQLSTNDKNAYELLDTVIEILTKEELEIIDLTKDVQRFNFLLKKGIRYPGAFSNYIRNTRDVYTNQAVALFETYKKYIASEDRDSYLSDGNVMEIYKELAFNVVYTYVTSNKDLDVFDFFKTKILIQNNKIHSMVLKKATDSEQNLYDKYLSFLSYGIKVFLTNEERNKFLPVLLSFLNKISTKVKKGSRDCSITKLAKEICEKSLLCKLEKSQKENLKTFSTTVYTSWYEYNDEVISLDIKDVIEKMINAFKNETNKGIRQTKMEQFNKFINDILTAHEIKSKLSKEDAKNWRINKIFPDLIAYCKQQLITPDFEGFKITIFDILSTDKKDEYLINTKPKAKKVAQSAKKVVPKPNTEAPKKTTTAKPSDKKTASTSIQPKPSSMEKPVSLQQAPSPTKIVTKSAAIRKFENEYADGVYKDYTEDQLVDLILYNTQFNELDRAHIYKFLTKQNELTASAHQKIYVESDTPNLKGLRTIALDNGGYVKVEKKVEEEEKVDKKLNNNLGNEGDEQINDVDSDYYKGKDFKEEKRQVEEELKIFLDCYAPFSTVDSLITKFTKVAKANGCVFSREKDGAGSHKGISLHYSKDGSPFEVTNNIVYVESTKKGKTTRVEASNKDNYVNSGSIKMVTKNNAFSTLPENHVVDFLVLLKNTVIKMGKKSMKIGSDIIEFEKNKAPNANNVIQ